MKKLKWLALILIVSLIFGMVACKQSIEPHRHVFAKEWTKDANYHWHGATCRHTSEVSDKAAHTFGDWTTTKEATEEAEGTKERSCTVCGYTATEKIAKLPHTHTFATEWSKDKDNHWYAATCGHEVTEGKAAHTFGEWTTTKEATEEAEGSKEKTCTACGEKATEAIEKLPHTHKFAEEWSKDETYHWHASTCGHEDEEVKEEHTFGDWIITKEATKDVEGSKYRICAVCNKEEVVDFAKIPEDFVLVEGETITGTETWTPTSKVFVSGRSFTIPNLYVSDHEVTRGEYLEVMGNDPSTAKAYDKDGNELTGEDVLNTPVNEVNWYDALVYCNKLSIMGNLTPCYSINGSTNPEDWGEVPTSSDSTWNAVTCNFEADGYRLPTEAEWEWFARGGENYEYAGSDTPGEVAWYKDNPSGTREVKTKEPNGYGLYDMSGNVREWCWDWYVNNIDVSIGEYGAASGDNRVKRGGSWYDTTTYCKVYNHSLSDVPERPYKSLNGSYILINVIMCCH